VPSHPHLVAEHQDVILGSVNDVDMSIRMRALDLVSAMVDSQNLQSIVQQLLSHLVQPETPVVSAVEALAQASASSTSFSPAATPSQTPAYRLLLAQKILSICSAKTYANVTDFEWYLSVLVDLTYVARVNVGRQICAQVVDVVARVRQARRYAVGLAVKLLSDNTLLSSGHEDGSCIEVLWAAAWIAGEYCRYDLFIFC
jgi:AP-3 complex subunit delta